MTTVRNRARPSAGRRAAVSIVVGAVCFVGVGQPGPAAAQTPASGVLNDRATTVVLEGRPEDANTIVAAPSQSAAEAATGAVGNATFVPTYSGFSSNAQGAFQRALDIWASVLNSPVPIRVVANFVSMSTGSLGTASATTVRDFAGAPQPGTYYPLALANARAGRDLFADLPDIQVDLNSSVNWHFGTTPPPSGAFDFTSVALHEIGHGLGFMGSMSLSSGTGRWGTDSPPRPDAYDRFTTNASRQLLITAYPNPSTALGNALQSNAVYFDSPQTNAADGTGRPKLHAPSPWRSGSSYVHLDELTYPPGDPNSLMTPTLFQAEVVHSPGRLSLCILTALGWSTSQACGSGSSGAAGTTTVSPTVSEPGGTLIVGATGVGDPGGSYTFRMGTTAQNCPQSTLILGSAVTATAGGVINSVPRTIPANVTVGLRWFCWGGTDDDTIHTVPTSVTLT